MLHAVLVALDALIEIAVGGGVAVGENIGTVKIKSSLWTLSMTSGALLTAQVFTGERPPLMRRCHVLSGGANRLTAPTRNLFFAAVLPDFRGPLTVEETITSS